MEEPESPTKPVEQQGSQEQPAEDIEQNKSVDNQQKAESEYESIPEE